MAWLSYAYLPPSTTLLPFCGTGEAESYHPRQDGGLSLLPSSACLPAFLVCNWDMAERGINTPYLPTPFDWTLCMPVVQPSQIYFREEKKSSITTTTMPNREGRIVRLVQCVLPHLHTLHCVAAGRRILPVAHQMTCETPFPYFLHFSPVP